MIPCHPQLLHSVAQRVWVEAQEFGGAAGTVDFTAGFREDHPNMAPCHLIEAASVACRAGRARPLRRQVLEDDRAARIADQGALHDIGKLPDIAGPVVLRIFFILVAPPVAGKYTSC